MKGRLSLAKSGRFELLGVTPGRRLAIHIVYIRGTLGASSTDRGYNVSADRCCEREKDLKISNSSLPVAIRVDDHAYISIIM
jgi:hypothetical protein